MDGSDTTVPVAEVACREKERLAHLYAMATASYSHAMETLQKKTGVLSKTKYEELSDFAETARTEVEKARAALDLHTVEHGC